MHSDIRGRVKDDRDNGDDADGSDDALSFIKCTDFVPPSLGDSSGFSE